MQKSKNYKVVNFCTLMICSCKVNYLFIYLFFDRCFSISFACEWVRGLACSNIISTAFQITPVCRSMSTQFYVHLAT